STTLSYTLSLHDALPIYESAVTMIPVTDSILSRNIPHITVDPYRDDVFYATVRSAGVILRSIDGGRSWQRFAPYLGGTEFDAARSEEHTSELQSRRDLVC